MYEYSHCVRWDVPKPISALDEPEPCPICKVYGERQLALPAPVSTTAGDWNRVEYNHGLGQWTKSWKHGRQIAKAKGLEEVGNESAVKVGEQFARAREEKHAALWADDRDKVYD